MTTDLEDRVRQHGEKFPGGFTSRYNVNGLVYFERFGDIRMAIAREKQVKGWRREKRVALIESKNPHWVDLYESDDFGPETALNNWLVAAVYASEDVDSDFLGLAVVPGRFQDARVLPVKLPRIIDSHEDVLSGDNAPEAEIPWLAKFHRRAC